MHVSCTVGLLIIVSCISNVKQDLDLQNAYMFQPSRYDRETPDFKRQLQQNKTS